MSLTAAGIPDLTRPGHFLAVACGGDDGAMLLRRAFSIYNVASRGVYGGTVDIVFAVHGKGTGWLAQRHRHDIVDIVGPLGKPFALPRQPVSCVLVAGGYGSAPMFMLADQLRERGCRVDVVLGAATEDKLFGVLDAKRIAATLTLATEDGSVGRARAGHRRAAGGAGAYRRGRGLRVRADGDARRGRGRRAGPRRARPVRGRGVDGLRDRGVHDLRAAGHR